MLHMLENISSLRFQYYAEMNKDEISDHKVVSVSYNMNKDHIL